MGGERTGSAGRSGPTTPAEYWWLSIIEDLIDGTTDTSAVSGADKKLGISAIVKRPARLIKIASQTTGINQDYPLDGGTTPSGSTTTVVKLHASAQPQPGMLLVFMDGTLLGEVRRIDSVSGTDVTINRATASACASGVTTRLLVPAFLRTRLILKGETSVNSGDVEGLIKYFLFPRTAAGTPVNKKPECAIEGPLSLVNLVLQGDTEETSYYHLGAHWRDVEGAIGWKFRPTALNGGTVSFWGGTT